MIEIPIDVTANYVRIRVASPTLFTRFRVKLIGKGIKAVIGFKKDGGSEIQSFLFPKDQYSLAEAKAWIKEHKYHVSETQAYLVNKIDIDPNTYELILEECEIKDYHEIPSDESLMAMINKEKKDRYAWLIE